MMTVAPLPARRPAIAAPMPREAPVTIATFPFRSFISSSIESATAAGSEDKLRLGVLKIIM
jgi:hypothetical protein